MKYVHKYIKKLNKHKERKKFKTNEIKKYIYILPQQVCERVRHQQELLQERRDPSEVRSVFRRKSKSTSMLTKTMKKR